MSGTPTNSMAGWGPILGDHGRCVRHECPQRSTGCGVGNCPYALGAEEMFQALADLGPETPDVAYPEDDDL